MSSPRLKVGDREKYLSAKQRAGLDLNEQELSTGSGSLPRGDIRPKTLEVKASRQDTYENRTVWYGH